MTSRVRRLFVPAIALVLAFAACSEEREGASAATTGTSTSTTEPGGATPTTGADATSTSGGTGTGGATGGEPTASGTGGLLPNGSPCMEGMECESGECFLAGPLGGVCSECTDSADCEALTGFGCNFGNPVKGIPAVCSKTGGAGQGCEGSDDCARGFSCAPLIDVPGVLTISTCSECDPLLPPDCMNGGECAPNYDLANLGGSYACAPAGSVPDGSGCSLNGDGSECQSGICASAALMGVTVAGICSQCSEQFTWCDGMSCQLPELTLEGGSLVLAPGMCV